MSCDCKVKGVRCGTFKEFHHSIFCQRTMVPCQRNHRVAERPYALKQKASVATIATSINKEAENKITILGTALDSKVKRLSG